MISSTRKVMQMFTRRELLKRNLYCSALSMPNDKIEVSYFYEKGGVRSLSTTPPNESKGFLDRMKDKIDERSQKNQADKYAEQIRAMAESERWDLRCFANEIDKSLGGWRSKIPGMSDVEQVKAVKENQKLLNGLIAELGENATANDLNQLGRKEKLKISLKTDVSVEAINMIVQQFQGMDIMHRILRHRKSNGQTIPSDERTMQRVMQTDADKVMTKTEKRNMQTNRAQKSMRGIR